MTATVLLGLDGATFAVLDPLMADGTMPRLKEFADGGTRAPLLSTPNPLTPPAWTTVTTGRTPGHHGILDFIRAEEGKHGMFFRVTDSRDVRCETIWSLASRQDRRVTALNFYGTFPVRPVAGYMVAGFVPGRHMRRACYPPELFQRLSDAESISVRALGMDLDEEKKCLQGMSAELYEEWVRLHIQRERQWFETLRYLMKSDPSDLTAIVFDGVDKLQHLCWRLLDPRADVGGLAPWERHIRALCLDYFRQLDDIIGETLGLAGRDARVFIVSDHGFGPTDEIVYINVWLERQGLLRWSPNAPKDEAEAIMVDRLKNHMDMLDWDGTTAYALTPSSNGIFIRGVSPERYPEFRARLIAALERFTDERTGERIVTAIRTREEAFPGAQGHLAPDLTLTLRDGGLVSILNADATVRPRTEVVGTHRPQGIFIARGPGIRAGTACGPLSITDVAPTLVYSLGLDVPADFEGAVPAELFDGATLAAAPPRIGPATRPVDDGAGARTGERLDAASEALVMERLKGLGYLE